MSAKKRGPGRPPKNAKSAKAKHSVPNGFWPQVGAIVLIVVALIIGLGLFLIGGVFPVKLAQAIRWLIGWTAFILPFVLVWQAVQIFRREGDKVWVAAILCLLLAGLFQLLLDNPQSQAESLAGNGGGIFGWMIASGCLQFLNAPVAALILVALIFILLMYILDINLNTIMDAIASLFKREDVAAEGRNAKIAKTLAADDKTAVREPVKLKLNKGVETVDLDKRHNEPDQREKTKPKVEEKAALTTASDPDWEFPSVDLLSKKQRPADPGDVEHNAELIHDTLAEFNIKVEMEGANIGPKVTQYTLKPPSGVKLSRITALESSLALNLAASTLRIEAPIPGKSSVGIEVPNIRPADVRLHGILKSEQWKNAREPLSFSIGLDIAGDSVIGELNKMPHLVIAGQTGSGKSVMINSLLCSLLYRNSPSDMKLILVDPKQVELTPYNDIPHLLTPVITEPEKTISALKWAVNEMERRYSLLSEEHVRDIKSYNQKQTEEAMPYIVIVVDEMADLMMLAKRDVESLVVRIAQKARAVGIHLVLATQRPSVDVITGLIKANVPARIAFTVASQVDSRTILDKAGAEKLLGQGDMLMITPSMAKPKRVQGAFLSDDEVVKITDFLRLQRPPEYNTDIISQQVQINDKGGVVMNFEGSGDDEYRDAVRVVVEAGKASTSLLQRRLRIGYSKAARIMEEMEDNSVIGPQDGSRPRDVLISSLDDLGE